MSSREQRKVSPFTQRLSSQAATPRGSSAHPDGHLLTGLLFDDTGDRMSPTHARAHGRRYRYYISSRIKGAKRTDNTAWRIPAPELDSTIVRFVTKLLADRTRLVDWIRLYAPDADLTLCLDQAGILRARCATSSAADQRVFLQDFLQSVTLGTDTVAFTLNVSELVTMLQAGQTNKALSEDGDAHVDPLISIKFPISVKRRGNEMRIVLQHASHGRNPDPQLVNLIARAHLYLEHLTRAPGISVGEVAERFGVHRVDVGRILPLAFLAPKAVDQILTGNQPDHISARNLARSDLPNLWVDQVAALA